jgi:hypothetical protein
MKTIEELRKALLVAKKSIEENLEELNRLEKEEEPVTLRIQYGETKWEEEITIPQSKLCDMKGEYIYIKNWDDITEPIWTVTTKRVGPLAGKAFVLNDNFDWELGADEEGALCLVPLKKDKEK